MPARLKEKLRQLQPHPQLSPTCDNRVFADNLVLFTNAQKLYGRQAWGVMEVFPNHYRLLANRISVIPVKIPDEPSPRSRSLQTRSVGQCKKLHFWIEYGVHTDVGCNIWSTLCPVEVRRSTLTCILVLLIGRVWSTAASPTVQGPSQTQWLPQGSIMSIRNG